jgi:uncharacterized protein YbjT (DUF2867 family)
MILVIGATGTIGTQLVQQLKQDAVEFRALTRSAEKAGKLGPQGWARAHLAAFT